MQTEVAPSDQNTGAGVSRLRLLLEVAGLMGLIAGLAVGGVVFTRTLARYEDRAERVHLLGRAKAVAGALGCERVAALRGVKEDVSSPAYQALRTRLDAVHKSSPYIRYAYIIGVRDGKVRFLVDAVDPTSPDGLMPGEIYDDVPADAVRALESGQPTIIGPYTDKWGTWITGFVPIRSNRTGEVCGGLGLDMAAEGHFAEVNQYRMFGVAISVLFSGVVLSLVFWLWRQKRYHRASMRNLQRIRTLSQAVEQSPVSVIITDRDANIEYANDAFTKVSGYTREEALGQNPSILNSGKTPTDVFEQMWGTILDGRVWKGEFINRRKDGQEYIEEASIGPVVDDKGAIVKFVAVKQDVTARKKMEAKMRELSRTDGLTGLANRRVFDEALEAELSRARRTHFPISLVLLDIDFFKRFNDTYGHQAGDDCLRQLAGVLKDSARRPGDLATRYGGEEFALILPQTDANAALTCAERVRAGVEALAIRHEKSDVSPVVTVSLGVATLRPDADSKAAHLIKQADAALYRAKEEGRNRAVASGA